MAFMTVGDIPVQITAGMIAESTLNPNGAGSIDAALEVKNEDGTQSDWWRGNISGDYTKVSNRQGQTNSQVTHDNLVQLGYQGPDFSQYPTNANIDWNAVQAALSAMAGTVTTAHCARSRCEKYINVKWLGGGGGSSPVAFDISRLMPSNNAGNQNNNAAGNANQGGGFGNQQQNNNAGNGNNGGGFGNQGGGNNQGGFGG